MSVRVRYGPSPTGEPHVGNLRTALFDWLFARHHGGQFIIRIEDTDQRRTVEGAVEQTLDALRWLGIDWDEGPDIGGAYGPYVQSQRLARYREATERLLAQGDAYTCTCSPERLAQLRKQQQARKEPPRYDGRCRDLTPEQRAREAEAAGQRVVRFKTPQTGSTVVQDAIRGDVRFENALLDDHVLLKSDGYPTYHLAVVVDDAAMAISHVFRGDEWLSSAPRHLLLHRALDLTPPVFVHLPVILGPDRGKLSKRHGATSVRAYADQGYLPEAMVNFMALLGWAKDDRTTYLSRAELIQHFDIPGLGKTSATFDVDRLQAMNGHYLRALPPERFAATLQDWLDAHLPPAAPRPLDPAYVRRIAPLIQERIKLLGEAVALTDFFFLPGPFPYRNRDLMGKGFRDNPSGALAAVDAARRALPDVESWEDEPIERALRGLAAELDLKAGALFTPIRVAVTGKTAAPPLFETLAVLGRERTLERLNEAAERLARPDD